MPYIGNITQDFSVNTAMLNSDSVTSIKIDDGTIVNADINDSAAIAGSKINPVSLADVGIGVSSPNVRLHQHIGTSGTNSHRFTNTTTGTGSTDGFILGLSGDEHVLLWNYENTPFRLATNSTERIRVTESGNVGIGVSSPTTKFHVLDTSKTSTTARDNTIARFLSNASNADCNIQLSNGVDHSAQLGIVGNGAEFYIAQDGTERFRINSSGEVGIGTTSPGQLLSIKNTNAQCQQSLTAATNGSCAIYFGDTDSVNRSTIIHHNTGDYLSFGTAAAERVRINSVGDVGIGTTSPGYRLTVKAASGTDTTALFRSDDANAWIQIRDNTTTDTAVMVGANGDNLLLRAGSNERVRIDSTGKVGIGVTDPTRTIDAHVTDSGANYIHLTNTGTGTGDANGTFIGLDAAEGALIWNQENNYVRFGTNNTERMRIDSSGNVGIGTSNPSRKLNVNAGTDNVVALFESTDTEAQVRIKDNDSNEGIIGVTAGAFAFENTTTGSLVKILADGKVGIGTTSPHRQLHQHEAGSVANYHQFTNADTGSGATDGLLVGLTSGVGHGLFWHYENQPIRFATNNSERMRINADGSIRIGSTSAGNTRLHITAFGTSNVTGNNALRVNDSTGTHLFIIRDDGLFQTGAGAASPYNLTGSTGANVFIHANSKSLRRSTSSIKYKKDIADATWGLAEVLKLRPVTFKSNGTGELADDQTYGGFTAEDIHDAGLTEFVQYNENNEPDALSYGNMVALLTNAIKELSAKVAALEAA